MTVVPVVVVAVLAVTSCPAPLVLLVINPAVQVVLIVINVPAVAIPVQVFIT